MMRATAGFTARWDQVRSTLVAVSYIAAAIGVAVALGAPLIVSVLLRHGRFTAADGSVVTNLIRWYAIGFVANMIVLCAERALLATARNRQLLEFGSVRALTRLGIVFLAVTTLALTTFPIAYGISEIVYLSLILRHLHSNESGAWLGAQSGEANAH